MKHNWFKSFWPSLLWLVFIFVISLVDGNQLPKNNWFKIIHLDKIVHGLVYFVQFILFAKGSLYYANRVEVPARIVEGYLLICGAIGALIEYLQSSISSHRNFDIWDMAANILGAIIASFLYERICTWKIFNLIWR
jgi:VanZ family protein